MEFAAQVIVEGRAVGRQPLAFSHQGHQSIKRNVIPNRFSGEESACFQSHKADSADLKVLGMTINYKVQ